MGVNKSITIEGATFEFEVKSKDGVMHVSLYSGEGAGYSSRVGEAEGKQTLYGAGA